MSAVLIMLILVALLCVGIVVTIVVVVGANSRRTPAGAEERAVRLVPAVGLVAGVAAAAWVLVEPTPFDRGLGSSAVVAPLCFGAVALMAALVGELVVRPRFSTGPRSAGLRPRSLRDHLPPKLTRLVTAVTVAGVLLCAWTLLTAGPDDFGRAGRSLTAQCSDLTTSSRGPYPGSFYVTPYLVGLAVLAAVGLLAATRISRRSLGADADVADRYRRTGLVSVVSAYGLALSTPLAGIAFFAGTALLGHSCPEPSWRIVGVAALVVALSAIGTGVVCLIGLLAPASVSLADPPRADSPVDRDRIHG